MLQTNPHTSYQELCVVCADIQPDIFATESPTSSPFLFSSLDTPAPVGIFSDTPAPTIDPNNAGDGEQVGGGEGGDLVDDCGCLEGLTEREAEVLAIRGKDMVCDPTCSDGSDLIWGELLTCVVAAESAVAVASPTAVREGLRLTSG